MEDTAGRDAAPATVLRQEQRIAAALGQDVRLEATGGASRTFRVGADQVVTVPLTWPDRTEPAAELVRRATLQERIGGRVSVPVPRVVGILPDAGLVVVRRLEGERLIDAGAARRRAVRGEVATAVGSLLAELHTWEREAYDDVAAPDDYSPADWRDEAAELARDLDHVLDDAQRGDVRRFLADRPPPAVTPVLSHNDLGIEHVLISDTSGAPAVTGVIDWDDAAICDPAYDFGLLLRDLGPDALDAALSAYADGDGDPREIPGRARFYARCKLLEDLAFGHSADRPAYVEKSIAAWPWTFKTTVRDRDVPAGLPGCSPG